MFQHIETILGGIKSLRQQLAGMDFGLVMQASLLRTSLVDGKTKAEVIKEQPGFGELRESGGDGLTDEECLPLEFAHSQETSAQAAGMLEVADIHAVDIELYIV